MDGPFVKLSPADAAIMETFVVPRYLKLFADPVQEMLLLGEEARIVHLACRTGYPDLSLLELADNVSLVGVDASLAALELARNKRQVRGDVPLEYLVAQALPTELPSEQYSHALCLHPVADMEARDGLFSEMARLLYSGGQALVALPLRGSFIEILDLLKEYALKTEQAELSEQLDEADLDQLTIELLAEELEAAGLDDVYVEVKHAEIEFDSGRAFLDDPVSRLMIIPEVHTWPRMPDLAAPLSYVADAIDRYWSEDKLSLTLSIGCASARKP